MEQPRSASVLAQYPQPDTARLSAALAAAGCPVLALGTAAVSLEDVFLELEDDNA